MHNIRILYYQILKKMRRQRKPNKNFACCLSLHTASKPPSPLKPLEVHMKNEGGGVGGWYLAGPNRNSIKDGLEHPKAPV